MKKVLIAEDEQALLNALVKKVSSSGYEVLLTSNGVDASEQALKEKSYLLLSNIMMFGKRGIDIFN